MAKKLSLAKNKTKQDIVNLPEPDEVDIDTLSDKDHVRLRRGMYLPNQNYCAYEILDNAVDEFMAGYCKNIWLQIEPDTTMRIQDDGRGVPLRPSKKDPNKPMVQVALGELKSGGKFNQQAENAVKTGGLNGTGASAVNFTCDHFVATVTQKGIMHQIAWEKGELVQPLTVLGKADEDDIQNGTLIELVPDKTIWVDDDYDINAIVKRAEQLTFLNSGLSIHLDIDYNNKKVETSFCNPEGLTAYINKLSEKKEKIIDPVSIRSEFKGTKVGDIEIEVALGYNTGYSEEIYAFTNNVPNPLGGHHIVGFKEGLFRAINSYYNDNTKGKVVDLVKDDVREGLISVVSVRVADPVFDGQGKAKLNMPSLRAVVRESTIEMMEDFLDKNPDKAKLIVAKALQAQNTRESVRKARETARSTKNLFGGTPAKLVTCTSKNPDECEIFYVEGDSAGGTAKKARDHRTQAILPVFGKINNTENMNLKQIIDSVKLKEIITSLGTGIGEDFDIDKLKYHKIIIMSDADDDGLHIQTLYLTFFYRHMRPLLEGGYVYISCPPLFKVVKDKKTHKYCYTIAEKDETLAEWGDKCQVFRYKGLGEMETDDLRESTMDPKSRVLLQVKLSENPEYDETIMTACMGDDVSLRKELILEEDEEELGLI